MNKELKIGFVSVLAIIVLFIGINYLKGLNVLNSSRMFYAEYDNIGGLKLGSSVFLNGFQVGLVSDVSLLSTDEQKLLVTINIDKNFGIPLNSVCRIVNYDLMGMYYRLLDVH